MGLKETVNPSTGSGLSRANEVRRGIKNLPHTPGVYIMKGASGEVLYVGKADNLRKRVSSYFQVSRRHPDRIALLVSQIADVAHLPTATSAEALLYENGLIKQLSPKYNVALRDDKSYPMLKITLKEKFPRLMITREKKEKKGDGSIYYGPYTNAKLLKEALKTLRKLFPLRTCSKMPKRKCLEFDMSQCLGPCEGRVGEERYGAIIKELRLFLEGRHSDLLKLLAERMKQLSKDEKFEEAAECRNRLEALSSVNTDRVKYGPANELGELKRVLGIKGNLEIIEAFDVSNIMGDEAVGSMIYFRKGKPDKNEYRKFKIKTVTGMDDYSMMREIVRRRYRRSVEEKKELPDLIVIDGGRGHLSVALDELKKLRLDDLPVIGIAKPARRSPLVSDGRGEGGEFERVYVKDKKDPILLPKESKALHLLERVRDEAHRFAISYHKKLMSKRIAKGIFKGV
ncbi:MAG: excinuclease ABC subunit UvrC [Candidatus Omnitrophica bacterium]|nr:excinuclease ABC subunit UvrC [Candidatus Omnitrophota bacterium]